MLELLLVQVQDLFKYGLMVLRLGEQRWLVQRLIRWLPILQPSIKREMYLFKLTLQVLKLRLTICNGPRIPHQLH